MMASLQYMLLMAASFLFCQRSLRCGEMPMLYALMWIALCAWTRGLMSWQNFVELERLLQNGLPGLVASIYYILIVIDLMLVENCSQLMTPAMELYIFYFVGSTRAMSGYVPFEQALAARLSLFNPSLSQVQEFLEKRPPRYKTLFYNSYFFIFQIDCFSTWLLEPLSKIYRTRGLEVYIVVQKLSCRY